MKPAVHIQTLYLDNFRRFQEFSLDFHPRLNVFLGNNGAGKSSLLDALSISLGDIIQTLGNNSAVKTGINYDDIYTNAPYSRIALSMFDEHPISWKLQATPDIKDGKKGTQCFTGTPELLKYIERLKQYILYPQNKQNLPIFVSYQAIRNPFDVIAVNDTRQADLTINTCYDEAISMNPGFGNFFIWFKTKEDLENENKIKNKDFDYTDPQLQVVREAMQTCLGFSSFTVNRQHGTFSLKKHAQDMTFNQLSDGEKGYLLLVADIARRLAIANPYNDTPLSGKGVVIIDEIELHLHPKWQRAIISQLLHTFTGCQFIITTHSPQVVGEVKPENIWILEEGQAPYHPNRSYGMDSSELLQEVMRAPSTNEQVSAQLVDIERSIDHGEYDDARRKISALAKETGSIPSLIGANTLLIMEGEESVELGE